MPSIREFAFEPGSGMREITVPSTVNPLIGYIRVVNDKPCFYAICQPVTTPVTRNLFVYETDEPMLFPSEMINHIGSYEWNQKAYHVFASTGTNKPLYH